MPKIKYGPTIADMRGSSGAATYSQNTAGAFLSNRAHPSPKMTIACAASQAAFSAAAHGWRALTAAQRAAWIALAAAPPEIDYDPWAVQSFRSGFTWFCRIYIRQLTTAEVLPTAPPANAQPTAPTITAATIAAYGSANAASYITFTSPQPNLVQNGGFEAPYTAGVAANWTATIPARNTPSQETVDVYAGASSQKAAMIAGVEAATVQNATFTITTHPGYWFTSATKVLSGVLRYINLYTPGPTYTAIWGDLANAAWTLRSKLVTPPTAGNSFFYVTNPAADAGVFLLDAFSITAPEYLILAAAVSPSPGRAAPAKSYSLLHATYSTTPTTISIGNALAALIGAYPPGWTVHFKLARQSLTGLRSAAATFSALTG